MKLKLYLPSDLIEAVWASSKIHAYVPRKKQIICTYVIKWKSYLKDEIFRTSCLNNLILVINLSLSEREFQALAAVYTVDFNPRQVVFTLGKTNLFIPLGFFTLSLSLNKTKT